MRKEIESLTQQLVKLDTTGGKTKEAAIVLSEFLRQYGIESTLNEYKEDCVNLEARIGKGESAIAISGHLDVVPVGNIDLWQHDPFSAKIIDNELWGRGSVDMKGGVAALAGVMVELLERESELTKEIRLLVTAEEEIGLLGAREMARGDTMKNVSHLLIAEPTQLEVAVMEKGILWSKISAKGKQAHASRPDLGTNAIESLASLIPKLHALLPKTSIPELGKSTLNVGMISGGTVPNVVPESAEMVCDIRTTPGVGISEVTKAIESLLVLNSHESLQLDIEYFNNAEAVITSNNELGETIAKYTDKYTNFKPRLGGMYYATDGAALLENHHASFAIFGPGSKEYLHQTNERLDLEQLDLARKIIRDSIAELAINQ
ncbi:MAG: M20 family metallopeptidase [Candidatus Heimdallarchaeota archaeon]|nr:M20 family metallopeptidase [Candidatus Heimdallarchaeota archaeon]